MSVILHMSVITQDGVSALMGAAIRGETEACIELVKAGANVDMQNKVICDVHVLKHAFTIITQYGCTVYTG